MTPFRKRVQPQLGKFLMYLRDVFWPALPEQVSPPHEAEPPPETARSVEAEAIAESAQEALVEGATPVKPQEPAKVRGDARVLAMLEASTLAEKRALAKAHPELRPPYSFFDDDVNEQLAQVLWGGLSLSKAGAEWEDIQRALETMYARSKVRPLEPYQ